MRRDEFVSYFHPHRLPRGAYQGVGTTFFSFNIDGRPSVLHGDVAEHCVALLKRALPRQHCRGDAFCFMPDHVHVLATGMIDSADTWQAIVEFKQQTGQWFWQQQLGFHWQKGFDARIVRPYRSLDPIIAYIVNNPVRKGLVEHWEDYPYTGAIDWESWTWRV